MRVDFEGFRRRECWVNIVDFTFALEVDGFLDDGVVSLGPGLESLQMPDIGLINHPDLIDAQLLSMGGYTSKHIFELVELFFVAH